MELDSAVDTDLLKELIEENNFDGTDFFIEQIMLSLNSNNDDTNFKFVWNPELKNHGFEKGNFSRRCATCLKSFFGSEDSVVCKRCASNSFAKKEEKLRSDYKKSHFEKLEKLIKDESNV